jgi:hypothetical protein
LENFGNCSLNGQAVELAIAEAHSRMFSLNTLWFPLVTREPHSKRDVLELKYGEFTSR